MALTGIVQNTMSPEYGTTYCVKHRYPDFDTNPDGTPSSPVTWKGGFGQAVTEAYRSACVGWFVKVVGTDLTLLSWGRNPFEGEVEVVKLMKVSKGRAVKGAKDPLNKGCVLVRLDDAPSSFPKLGKVPPRTYYRYNTLTKLVECMVTYLPSSHLDESIPAAWDTCRECVAHIRTCKCREVSPSRAVIHVYELATGEPFYPTVYTEDRRIEFAPLRPPTKDLPGYAAGTPLSKVKLEKVGSKPLEKLNGHKPKKDLAITKDFDPSSLDGVAARLSKASIEKIAKRLTKG